MANSINHFDHWLQTPLGQYLLEWEQPRLDKAVEDIFGYNALQLGQPRIDGLANCRIANRWLALEKITDGSVPQKSPVYLQQSKSASLAAEAKELLNPNLFAEFHALPFPEQSIDLVILPHTLELVKDPHATLREVARVLVPEGKVVLTGINPASLWGLLQKRTQFSQRFGDKNTFLPLEQGALIHYRRLRDWMRLLNLDICAGSFGCYRPPFKTEKWLNRTAWMEKAGDRWWPILGATYQITAVKRIKGMRIITPEWSRQPSHKRQVAAPQT